MITATALELRAGPRLLLGTATFRDRAGRPGRPGRPQRRRQDHPHPGAGRRGAARRPAASPVAARSATCRRTRAPATSTSSPATASCPPAGSTTVVRRMRETEGAMAGADPDTRERAMRRYARLEDGVPGRGRLRRRVRGRRHRRQPGAARAGARPAAAHAVRRSAPAGRAGPHPVLATAETLLLDEPTNHLDADSIVWLRDYLVLQGRAGRHQPRRRPARARSSTGCSTSTPTAPCSTSTTWAGRPTCSSARPTSGAASGSGPTPRSRPPRCKAQADRMRAKATKARRRAEHGQAGRAAAGRARGGPRRRQGRQAALPRPGALRQDAADRRGPVQVLRLARGLHRRRPGHRPGEPGRRSSA